MNDSRQKGTIKTSPLAMLESVVAIEVLVGAVNIILSLFIHYEEIYVRLPINNMVSFNIFSIVILSLAQIIIIFIAFVFWYSEKYVVDKTHIVYTCIQLGNRFQKSHELAMVKDIESVLYSQNFVQRLFGIGTLTLKLSTSSKPKKMVNIPNPAQTVKYLNTFRFTKPPLSPSNITKLISEGENKQLEFKSSFLWDYQTNSPNKELNKPVAKSIAAFLNTSGGTLIIGVNDQKQILGIENDLKLVKRQNTDGFENLLVSCIGSMIGVEYNHYIDISFKKVSGKTVCLVKVRSAGQPVYLKHNDAEEFFVRTGNSSRPLSIREATEYILSRFRKRSSK